MRAIVRIRFEGGMLMLPSRTPYDVEILLENLECYAARYRGVDLEVDGRHWRVERGDEHGDVCARCARARAALTFAQGARVSVCRGCARVAVSTRFAEWPEPPRRFAVAVR